MLWNAAEGAEKRKDAQVAREIVLALPANIELSHDDRVELARSFASEHFVVQGPGGAARRACAAWRRRAKASAANHHAHLLITTRRLGEDGFASEEGA